MDWLWLIPAALVAILLGIAAWLWWLVCDDWKGT